MGYTDHNRAIIYVERERESEREGEIYTPAAKQEQKIYTCLNVHIFLLAHLGSRNLWFCVVVGPG